MYPKPQILGQQTTITLTLLNQSGTCGVNLRHLIYKTVYTPNPISF